MQADGDPNTQSPLTRDTPLHEAIYGGHTKVVKQLLRADANQLMTNIFGNVPLHEACRLGYVDIARCLINSTLGKQALGCTNKKGLLPADVCGNGYTAAVLDSKLMSFESVTDLMSMFLACTKAFVVVKKERIPLTERYKLNNSLPKETPTTKASPTSAANPLKKSASWIQKSMSKANLSTSL